MKRFVPPLNPKITLLPGEPGHGGELRRVPVADVHVLENLNLRVRGTPEYDEAVNEFAASIAANGFYDDKPLAGYLDSEGKVIVIDGHRRLEAVQRLNAGSLDGDVVTEIPVVLKGEDNTLADLTVAMIQSSSGKELTMFEKGIGVKRLMADGMSKEDVARRLGVTEKSVDNYLAVASVPAKARDLLLDGKVTSTQVLRAKGDTDKLTAMVKKAAEKGRTRARPSDAPEAATPSPEQPDKPNVAVFSFDVVKDGEMGAVLRQIAAAVRSVVPHDSGDSDAAQGAATVEVTVILPTEAKPKRVRKAKAAPEPTLPADDGEPDPLAHAIPEDL